MAECERKARKLHSNRNESETFSLNQSLSVLTEEPNDELHWKVKNVTENIAYSLWCFCQ